MTAVPYRLQNCCEEIVDVPLPWHMVYELIQHFQLKLRYNIFTTNRMLYIWGIQPSQLCKLCCKETESLDNLFWYCPYICIFIFGHCQLRTCEASVSQTKHSNVLVLLLSCAPGPPTPLSILVRASLHCSVKGVVHSIVRNLQFLGNFSHGIAMTS
jgi:hypothetical protein